MPRKVFFCIAAILISLLSGCASVPMSTNEQDTSLKKFIALTENNAGLYIYRNTFLGQGLKKTLYVDGAVLGETANKTYFYTQITPGQHILSTESEFSNNSITLTAKAGKNYYVQQHIKLGVFVGGAKLEIMPERQGQNDVLQCKLAVSNVTFKSPRNVQENLTQREVVPVSAPTLLGGKSKSQLIDELMKEQNITYEEYARRYKAISSGL